MKKIMISGSLMAISLLLTLTFWGIGTLTGAEAGFRPTIAVKLFGGLGYQSIGDPNAGLKGISDSIIYMETTSGYSAGGGYGNMHTGFDVGGDLIFQFSRYFGVGIGAGYLRTTRTSELKLTAMLPTLHNENYTFTPTLGVVPIRVSLFVFVPLGRVLKVSLNIGPEYYLASLSTRVRDEYPAWWWNERNEKTTGQGFGLHGGIGLEVRLSSMLSLLLEGQGRLAKINELTGTSTYTNKDGYKDQTKGTLYYWTDLWTFKPFPYILIEKDLPSEPWQQDARKAVLDLSGFSVVTGFVFRF